MAVGARRWSGRQGGSLARQRNSSLLGSARQLQALVRQRTSSGSGWVLKLMQHRLPHGIAEEAPRVTIRAGGPEVPQFGEGDTHSCKCVVIDPSTPVEPDRKDGVAWGEGRDLRDERLQTVGGVEVVRNQLLQLNTGVVSGVADRRPCNEVAVLRFAGWDVHLRSDNAAHALSEKERVACFSVALEPAGTEAPD